MKSDLAFLLFGTSLLSSFLAVAQAKPNTQITDAEINQAVQRDAPAMIELRHRVHQHPELSNREFETAKLVAERLAGNRAVCQNGDRAYGAWSES